MHPRNEYAKLLGTLYYESTKSIMAALAVACIVPEDRLNDAPRLLCERWQELHSKGVLPRLPETCRKLLASQ